LRDSEFIRYCHAYFLLDILFIGYLHSLQNITEKGSIAGSSPGVGDPLFFCKVRHFAKEKWVAKFGFLLSFSLSLFISPTDSSRTISFDAPKEREGEPLLLNTELDQHGNNLPHFVASNNPVAYRARIESNPVSECLVFLKILG